MTFWYPPNYGHLSSCIVASTLPKEKLVSGVHVQSQRLPSTKGAMHAKVLKVMDELGVGKLSSRKILGWAEPVLTARSHDLYRSATRDADSSRMPWL